MATYRMGDGTVVKTENAARQWAERTDWNGRNHISRASGTEWDHQTLYRSRKGRYYIEHTSQWEGKLPRAEWVSDHEAARWLLLMERGASGAGRTSHGVRPATGNRDCTSTVYLSSVWAGSRA